MIEGGTRTLEQVYAAACSAITRRQPLEAYRAAAAGAVIVDIRSDTARARDGVVPGAVHIPRTVLEWRLAADSPWRNPYVNASGDLILMCDHGYSSALAAASLRELGCDRAGDVIDGFVGWRSSGLPVAAAPPPFDGVPGTAPPDPS